MSTCCPHDYLLAALGGTLMAKNIKKNRHFLWISLQPPQPIIHRLCQAPPPQSPPCWLCPPLLQERGRLDKSIWVFLLLLRLLDPNKSFLDSCSSKLTVPLASAGELVKAGRVLSRSRKCLHSCCLRWKKWVTPAESSRGGGAPGFNSCASMPKELKRLR